MNRKELPTQGRVQVKARSRASKHLNWFHVRNVDRHGFDYLTLLEFEPDGSVGGAWGMTWAQVAEFKHSVVPDARGGLITKLAVRGDCKHHADHLPLVARSREDAPEVAEARLRTVDGRAGAAEARAA